MLSWKVVNRVALYVTLSMVTLCSSIYANSLSIAPQAAGLVDGLLAPNTNGLTYSSVTTTSGGFTVVSSMRMSANWDYNNSNPLILIGLSELPGQEPAALSLAWVKDQSSWVPRWMLVLAGGLHKGAAAFTDPANVIKNSTVLADVEPKQGHIYHSSLSYSPIAKTIAISVVDATTGELVHTSGLMIGMSPAGLYMSSGVAVPPSSATASDSVCVDRLALLPYYLPVATTWEVGVGTEGERIPSWLFSGEEPGYLLLETPTDASAGEFLVTLQTGEERRTIIRVPSFKDKYAVNLPVEQLPLGKSTLSLEYAIDGQRLLFGTQEIVAGNVTAVFEPVAIDREAHTVEAVFSVVNERKYFALPIKVEALLSQMIWDETQRIYSRKQHSRVEIFSGVLDVGPDSLVSRTNVQAAIPTTPGLWELKYVVTSSTGIATQTKGGTQLFNTYAPANLEQGKPFTIAVLPDTQLYTRTDKPIFMRMTQWIAEKAASSNIGLALHMGDITEQNQLGEWNIASESLHTMDGVVPYVLAVGNHDMLRPQDGYTVNDHDGSLINKYFPSQAFPAMQGSYAPDRIDNSFHTFKFNGQDYLVLSIEYFPRTAVLEWANKVVSEHPNHKVIVVTHSYLNGVGNRVNPGDEIWWDFVRHHGNIFMVLCGHISAATVPYTVSKGLHGNFVYQFMFDYQAESNGGNGYIGLLQFQPDNTIKVQVYSPYLGRYKFDVDRFFDSEYVIKVDEGKVIAP